MVDDIPGIALRGISKEFPWPGARCGWVEFYNRDKHPDFARYAKTIIDAKMLEVCSTTLPQKVLPKIMGNERYYPYLDKRNSNYWEKSQLAHSIFSKIPGLIVNKAYGAFYMTVLFEDGTLHKSQFLKTANSKADEIIKPLIDSAKYDKRFAYFLLASKGICVVPLSTGFNSDLYGFRITLLEPDRNRFTSIMQNIAEAANEYMNSN